MVTMVARDVPTLVNIEMLSAAERVLFGTMISQPGSTLPFEALETLPFW